MLGCRSFATLVEWARDIISGGDAKLYAFMKKVLFGLGRKTSKLEGLVASNP